MNICFESAGEAATGGGTTVPENRLHCQGFQMHQCRDPRREHWVDEKGAAIPIREKGIPPGDVLRQMRWWSR